MTKYDEYKSSWKTLNIGVGVGKKQDLQNVSKQMEQQNVLHYNAYYNMPSKLSDMYTRRYNKFNRHAFRQLKLLFLKIKSYCFVNQ